MDQYLNKSPNVILPGLGTSVELPRDVHLHVEGEVKDPLDFDAEFWLKAQGLIVEDRNLADKLLSRVLNPLMKWWTKEHMRTRFPDAHDGVAHCFEHKLKTPNAGRLFVISKRTELEPSMSLFADGHESAEFLQKIGRQDVMQEALKSEGIDLDVGSYSGEDFADLGGFLSLLKALKAGNSAIRIPMFKGNRENREKMGRLFGLDLPEEAPIK